MSKDLGGNAGSQEHRQWLAATERRPADLVRCHRGAEVVGRVAAHFVNEVDRRLADIERLIGRALESALSPSLRSHDLDWALDCARAAREVAQQFLVFSRGRLGSPDWIDFAGALEALRPHLHHLAGESIRLTIEPGPGRPLVHAPPDGLARVVTGLVADAADALPVGGTIEVRTSRGADETSVALTISPVGFGQQPLPEPANHDATVASWGGMVRLACDHDRHALFYEVVLPAAEIGEDE